MRPLALLTLLAAAAPLACLATPLRVDTLRCDYSAEPTDIDSARPALSWQLGSDEQGQRQSAWQLLVASSREALDRDHGDLWDSGKVGGPDTHAIPYAGKPLVSGQRAFWKVRSWNASGELSTWSPVATWSMGVLAPADWRGGWIGAPEQGDAVLLRGDFTVKPGLRRAIAYACGLGTYELRLNGAKVGRDLLAPGWTRFDRSTLYDTHEVTAQLREGANTAGFSLGNGMYNVTREGRFAKFVRSFGKQRAILMLRLEYADGSIQFVGTDDTWRAHRGPATFNGIYGGEDFDARLVLKGWDRPGFDASAWTPARPVPASEAPLGTLRGHSFNSQPVREIAVHTPLAVRELPGGLRVYDLGQNASHLVRLRIAGPAGSTVRLIPAEVVAADGTLIRTTQGGLHRGINWWQYTKATDAEETWTPQFFYVGCRYLQAEFVPAGGKPLDAIASLKLQPDKPVPATPEARAEAEAAAARLPRIVSLEGVVVHADAAQTGTFATSDTTLNRIRELVRWAQRSNMVSVLTDCPHREKLGWIEQFHLNGPAIRYEYDVNRIFTKAMEDMADAQTDEGLVPNIAPEYADFKGGFKSAAEWGAAFILVPWQQYLFTGDTRLLARHYDAMRRYVAYLDGKCVDGLLSEGLGDWYDVGPKKSGQPQHTPAPVTATAFLYHDHVMLARIATLLGKTADAAVHTARAAAVRERYNREFYKAAEGSYATGSQCANAMALHFGLVEEANRPKVLAALVRDIEGRGFGVTAGDIGFRYVLRALSDAGRDDIVLKMITQTDKPGYAWQLAKGATSLTEAWNANLGASHNHFMLGQVTEWFYHDLLGIQPDEASPGFLHIILRPRPVGDLAWCEGSYDSVRGPIKVRWEQDPVSRKFHYRVSLPANTTATLELPAAADDHVSFKGRPVEQDSLNKAIKRTPTRLLIPLQSGTYEFDVNKAK